jgi:hypothetical protein
MTIFGPSLSNGTPQFDRRFERKLIIGLLVFAALAAIAAKAHAGCNCSGSESAAGMSAAAESSARTNFNRQRQNAINARQPSFWSGFVSYWTNPRSGINAETSYVNTGYVESGTSEKWHLANGKFADGHREKGVVNDRGDFVSSEPQGAMAGNGLLGGSV